MLRKREELKAELQAERVSQSRSMPTANTCGACADLQVPKGTPRDVFDALASIGSPQPSPSACSERTIRTQAMLANGTGNQTTSADLDRTHFEITILKAREAQKRKFPIVRFKNGLEQVVVPFQRSIKKTKNAELFRVFLPLKHAWCAM